MYLHTGGGQDSRGVPGGREGNDGHVPIASRTAAEPPTSGLISENANNKPVPRLSSTFTAHLHRLLHVSFSAPAIPSILEAVNEY
jgi:hypothetical protein